MKIVLGLVLGSLSDVLKRRLFPPPLKIVSMNCHKTPESFEDNSSTWIFVVGSYSLFMMMKSTLIWFSFPTRLCFTYMGR